MLSVVGRRMCLLVVRRFSPSFSLPRAAELSGGRPLSVATWREAVADKTAAFDERLKGATTAMILNKETIEVAVGSIKADVGSIKADVKADVGGIKADVEKAMSANKADVEKAMSAIKADIEKAMSANKAAIEQSVASMEKVLKAELTEKIGAMEKGLNVLERLVFAAMAVFIFGKQITSAIS